MTSTATTNTGGTDTRRTTVRLAPLVLVTGVGPLATDAYLAALPQVRHDLVTSGTLTQLTMTAFIVGLAIGQLVFGPVSDGVGRRRMMLVSSALFGVASVGCALAPSIGVLLACRVLQGVAGGCGVALGRAVVSDRWSGSEAATRYGTLTAVTLLGPVIAPTVGSVVLAFGSWRAVFVGLAVVGVAMLAGVWFGVPETLPPERRQAHGLGHSLGRMGDLLRDRLFTGTVGVQCLATAAFFVYIGGSSLILQDQLSISPTQYAVLFATNAAAMSVMTFAFRFSVTRVGAPRLRTVGLLVSGAAAAALLVYALAAGDAVALAPTWVLLAVLVAGNGLTIPATTTMAQEIGRRASGTASALQGGLTFAVGSLALPLTGLTGHPTVLTMALLSTVLYLAAGLALVALRRARPASLATDL